MIKDKDEEDKEIMEVLEAKEVETELDYEVNCSQCSTCIAILQNLVWLSGLVCLASLMIIQ